MARGKGGARGRVGSGKANPKYKRSGTVDFNKPTPGAGYWKGVYPVVDGVPRDTSTPRRIGSIHDF